MLIRLQIAAVVAVYDLGFRSMIRDLHCTEFQATIGLSAFTFGFAVVPLVTASFSEEFGRLPLYIVSGIGFSLMYAMIALYDEFLLPYGSYDSPSLSIQGKKYPDGHCCTLFTRCVWVYSRYYGWRNHC